jgi:tetratricopeptide (TPR) repeat protein
MRCPRAPTLLIALGLATAAPLSPVSGQAPQPAPTTTGKLALSTKSSDAQAEFWKGLEDWQSYSYSSGQRHFRRAYALDNTFALARVLATGGMTTSAMAAERESALADAARQSTEEGLIALWWREKALGHPERSRVLLRAIVQLMPNEPGPAVEYLWAGAEVGTDPKQLADSARALRARFPSYGPVALVTGFASMNAGDTAGALRLAEEWTRTTPQSAASFGYYGGLLQQLHRYDEAEAQYRKGMQLLPAHADYGNDAASALAELLMLRGRTADARAVAAEALSRVTEPSDSALYMAELAGTYFATGDNRRAMQLLEQGRQKSETIGGGTNPFAFDYLLAEASAMTGDASAMRGAMGRLRLQTANDTAVFLANYANNYSYLGQIDSALVYSDRLGGVSNVPWSAGYAHHMRGVALAAAKQCARARAELSQAPDTASLEMRVTRAECELQLGNRAAALALRDRAIASPDFVLFDPAYVRQRQRLAQMK